jgi:hypothetical protein
MTPDNEMGVFIYSNITHEGDMRLTGILFTVDIRLDPVSLLAQFKAA